MDKQYQYALGSFNSTTVQLILLLTVLPLRALLFQFHNGTINTPSTMTDAGVLYRFNSTTVQLILRRDLGILFRLMRFNSTTVQLILLVLQYLLFLINLFQFHNGTINTANGTTI